MTPTSTDWLSASEIVFGLLLERSESPNKYHRDLFVSPYDDGFDVIKKHGLDETKIIQAVGISSFQACKAAADSLNGTKNEVDWCALIKKASTTYLVAEEMETAAKGLRRGREVNLLPIIEHMKNASKPDSIGLVLASDIDLDDVEELMECGWKAIDENLGGIPVAGIVQVGAETGYGKSFMSMKLVEKFLTRWPEKKAAIYSLEMPKQQYLSRGCRMYPGFSKVMDRIYVSSDVVTIDDIGIEAAARDVDIIIIDYVDYLVEGEGSEGAYGAVYKAMNEITRTLEIPVINIAQLNRNQYSDPIPRKYQFRYSGMAENVASQIWCLASFYNDDDTDGEFIYIEDSMYIICWKQRAGWEAKHRGPGAIVLPKVKNLWDDGPGKWIVHREVPHEIRKRKKE